jgi:phenylacetate-coenzyme A ligase PaaK-like adenylate-forming protein
MTSLKRALIFSLLRVLAPVRNLLLAHPRQAERLLRPGFEPMLWRLGEWRAWRAFELARRDVPAYRDFLAAHGGDIRLRGFRPDFSGLPELDKESYVTAYPIEARCKGGRLPAHGAVIDESSGTGGEPTNWVRGPEERADGRKLLQLGLAHAFGGEPLFVVNAFALGPWATGMNVTMSAVDVAVVKSVGPDIVKVVNTLRQFGPGYRYLVCGYPPFLKQLVDEAEIDWSAFTCVAVVGGEGMTEALRTQLERAFSRVSSSFGASDLEINIAAETELSIALRRLLASRPGLGDALGLAAHPGLPMVFQFSPLDYLIETNTNGELVITICRAATVAPKPRYNLHDLGQVVRFPELRRALAAAGGRVEDLAGRFDDRPLLFHWGRSDSTVAFYGANIAPTEVEEALLSLPVLARDVRSHVLALAEDDRANKTLTLACELRDGAGRPADVIALREELLARLSELNQDFREAFRFMPEGQPSLEFHARGTGPFAGHDIRLKRSYIRRD